MLNQPHCARCSSILAMPKHMRYWAGFIANWRSPNRQKFNYDQALKFDPECDDALLGLGHLCMENGQMERAEELFLRAIEFKPDNLAALIHLAQAKKNQARR